MSFLDGKSLVPQLALAIFKNVLGEDHPYTKGVAVNLAKAEAEAGENKLAKTE